MKNKKTSKKSIKPRVLTPEEREINNAFQDFIKENSKDIKVTEKEVEESFLDNIKSLSDNSYFLLKTHLITSAKLEKGTKPKAYAFSKDGELFSIDAPSPLADPKTIADGLIQIGRIFAEKDINCYMFCFVSEAWMTTKKIQKNEKIEDVIKNTNIENDINKSEVIILAAETCLGQRRLESAVLTRDKNGKVLNVDFMDKNVLAFNSVGWVQSEPEESNTIDLAINALRFIILGFTTRSTEILSLKD